MVSYTRKVFDSAASDQNNAVFLQVVADARDVSSYFNTVGQTSSGNLSQSRVRLFRSYCLNFFAALVLPSRTNWFIVGILFLLSSEI